MTWALQCQQTSLMASSSNHIHMAKVFFNFGTAIWAGEGFGMLG